jgi:hypothetical protein
MKSLNFFNICEEAALHTISPWNAVFNINALRCIAKHLEMLATTQHHIWNALNINALQCIAAGKAGQIQAALHTTSHRECNTTALQCIAKHLARLA